MSYDTRPKPVRMLVCDLCDQEIPEGEPGEGGSITGGWIANPVTERTRFAWLSWPPAGRERTATWQQRQSPERKPRNYDFHAECILRLVEGAIAEREETR